jgi:putative flavoprotein involved in K+ transport
MSIEGSYDAIVVGGGQAGLAAGYFLAQRKLNYVILDENKQTGQSWRNRWDSLRLFTPSQNDYLPGMKFPGPNFYFPTKNEIGDYLETYAGKFGLNVQFDMKVNRLSRNNNGYHVSASGTDFHAKNVIIATGAFNNPYRPAFSQQIDPGILQLHSVDYRNPNSIPVQSVLVVGAGNSGAEISLELAKMGKQVWLSGRDVGRIPADKVGRLFGGRLYWWFLHKVMSIRTPIGRRMKANVLAHGNPLIRASREEVAAAGVQLTSRLSSVSDGKPQVEGAQTIPAQGIIWATGFRPDYRWIDIPIFDENGRPRHERGIVKDAPGVYFVGMHFQTGLTSSLMGGVGDDADYIVRQLR